MLGVGVSPVAGQNFRGSTGSTLGGIGLGVYSGATFGLLGSLLPCDRTMNGGRCAALGASLGGALGVTMGGLIGAQNQDALLDRAESAGYGALIGAVVGVGLRYGVRQYGWGDAVTVAAIGGAVGAAPMGTVIGAGAGAATGAILWAVFPRAGFSDFVLFAVAGAAVGGMIDWVNGAATAKRTATPTFGSSFSFSIR